MSGDEANLAAVEEGNTVLEGLLAASHISEDRETAHGNEKPDGVRDESALDSLADGDGSGVKEIHAPVAEVQEVSRKVDAGHFDGGENASQDRGGEVILPSHLLRGFPRIPPRNDGYQSVVSACEVAGGYMIYVFPIHPTCAPSWIVQA